MICEMNARCLGCQRAIGGSVPDSTCATRADCALKSFDRSLSAAGARPAPGGDTIEDAKLADSLLPGVAAGIVAARDVLRAAERCCDKCHFSVSEQIRPFLSALPGAAACGEDPGLSAVMADAGVRAMCADLDDRVATGDPVAVRDGYRLLVQAALRAGAAASGREDEADFKNLGAVVKGILPLLPVADREALVTAMDRYKAALRAHSAPPSDDSLPGDWQLAFDCMERVLMHAQRQEQEGVPREARVIDYTGIYRKAVERRARSAPRPGGQAAGDEARRWIAAGAETLESLARMLEARGETEAAYHASNLSVKLTEVVMAERGASDTRRAIRDWKAGMITAAQAMTEIADVAASGDTGASQPTRERLREALTGAGHRGEMHVSEANREEVIDDILAALKGAS